MSGTLNKVILIGHMGNDIDMTHFETGSCVGRVSLATNETYKNKQGEKVQETQWHNCIFWNKAAELMEKHTKKGDKIFVEGRIKTRKWQDDQGNDRYSTEIAVKDFKFLGSKSEEYRDAAIPSKDDDDLPF